MIFLRSACWVLWNLQSNTTSGMWKVIQPRQKNDVAKLGNKIITNLLAKWHLVCLGKPKIYVIFLLLYIKLDVPQLSIPHHILIHFSVCKTLFQLLDFAFVILFRSSIPPQFFADITHQNLTFPVPHKLSLISTSYIVSLL